jgi:hypothetical protein
VLAKNQRMESLCWAYIEAVAAQCGVSCYYPWDDYGIDMTLAHIEKVGRKRLESGVKFDVQAKSTLSDADLGGDFGYDLHVRAYDVLRQPTFGNPRLLVLVVLRGRARVDDERTGRVNDPPGGPLAFAGGAPRKSRTVGRSA